jgi:hypothetical protein
MWLKACLVPDHYSPRHSVSPATENTVPWRGHAWWGGLWLPTKQALTIVGEHVFVGIVGPLD